MFPSPENGAILVHPGSDRCSLNSRTYDLPVCVWKLICTSVSVVRAMERVGATGGRSRTVTTKLVLVDNRPSLTVNVTRVMPDWLVAGRKLMVRLVPVPPITIAFIGSSTVFEDVTVSTRLAGAVSGSLIVNGIAPLLEFWSRVKSEIEE